MLYVLKSNGRLLLLHIAIDSGASILSRIVCGPFGCAIRAAHESVTYAVQPAFLIESEPFIYLMIKSRVATLARCMRVHGCKIFRLTTRGKHQSPVMGACNVRKKEYVQAKIIEVFTLTRL